MENEVGITSKIKIAIVEIEKVKKLCDANESDTLQNCKTRIILCVLTRDFVSECYE